MKHGRTQGEVRKKLAALTRDLDAGTYHDPEKMTVAQWGKKKSSERMDDYIANTINKNL